MSSSLIHKPVPFSRAIANRIGVKTLAELSQVYMAQVITDGQQAIVVQHPNKLFSGIMTNAGACVSQHQYIVAAVRQKFMWYVENFMPVVLFGTLTKIKSGPRSGVDQFVIHDMVLGPEYEEGISDRPFSERMDKVILYTRDQGPADYVRHARVYNAGTYGDAQSLANQNGGILLRDPNGSWISGNGRGGQIISVPSELCKQE
jgi:hypothetical protein